jgi:ferredoxin
MAIKKEIQHDKPNCIGCAACAAIDPKTWVMNKDGKADIVNGESFKEGWQRKDIKEEEFQDNMDAADSCPVNVIHIVEKEVDDSGKVINEKKLK